MVSRAPLWLSTGLALRSIPVGYACDFTFTPICESLIVCAVGSREFSLYKLPRFILSKILFWPITTSPRFKNCLVNAAATAEDDVRVNSIVDPGASGREDRVHPGRSGPAECPAATHEGRTYHDAGTTATHGRRERLDHTSRSTEPG